MTTPNNTSRIRRWSAGGLFLVSWGVVVVLALILTAIGIEMAGGAPEFRDWLGAAAPYALVWRLILYVGGGTLYVAHFRPRLRAMQRRQSDGGSAARERLIRIERMAVVVFIAVEVANAPDLIAWISG